MKYESVGLQLFCGTVINSHVSYFGGPGLQQCFMCLTCISSPEMAALVDIGCQIWHQLKF
jgi:hypothetical protein